MEVVSLASGEIPAADPELIIFVSALAENWGTDLILTVESAPPVNVLSSTAPLLGVTSALRPIKSFSKAEQIGRKMFFGIRFVDFHSQLQLTLY
jgi:hypothetical protein